MAEEGKAPFLQAKAFTDITFHSRKRDPDERSTPQGFTFANLDELYGITVATGKSVFSDNVADDPRVGALPKGHPRIECYCGLPFYFYGELIGMVGLANRPGGYEEEIQTTLAPLLSTIGSLIHAHRTEVYRAKYAAEMRDINVELQAHVEDRTRELMELNKKLREEVEERKAAQLAAEEAARARSLFLAKMSHELRTPLAPAIGLLDMLEEADNLTEDQQGLVRTVQGSSRTLLGLVNSVLEFAKGGAAIAEPNLSEVRLASEVRRREGLFDATAADHGISLSTKVAKSIENGSRRLVVETDAVRIGQLLNNLTSNGIKFARARVDVVVSCWDPHGVAGRRHDGIPETMTRDAIAPGTGTDRGFVILPQSGMQDTHGRTEVRAPHKVRQLWLDARLPPPPTGHCAVCISVVDDGAGVDEASQAKVFDAFVQGSDFAEGASTDSGEDAGKILGPRLEKLDRHGGYVPGTGLGLSICREVAMVLKGRIALESKQGLGSTFSVLIPMRVVRPASRPVELAIGAAGAAGGVGGVDSFTAADGASPIASRKRIEPLPDRLARLKYLIVDDNRTNRKVVHLQLKKLGIPPRNFVFAEDGLEAIHAQESAPADIIFMDLSMPRCGGVEATRRILAACPLDGPRPLVIALTANMFAFEEEGSHGAGFTRIVTKPTEINTLRSVLVGLPVAR